MTNIRHTAFRLTLEEVPELGSPPGIYAFAQNGMTSAEMLQRTYLRFIEEEATAKGHGHRFAQVIVRWSSGLLGSLKNAGTALHRHKIQTDSPLNIITDTNIKER